MPAVIGTRVWIYVRPVSKHGHACSDSQWQQGQTLSQLSTPHLSSLPVTAGTNSPCPRGDEAWSCLRGRCETRCPWGCCVHHPPSYSTPGYTAATTRRHRDSCSGGLCHPPGGLGWGRGAGWLHTRGWGSGHRRSVRWLVEGHGTRWMCRGPSCARCHRRSGADLVDTTTAL